VLTTKERAPVNEGIGDWVNRTLWRRNKPFASTESETVIHTGCKKNRICCSLSSVAISTLLVSVT